MEPMANITFDFSRCELCGEKFRDGIAEAEMYDPTTDDQSYAVHIECGRARDWEIA